MIDIDDDYHAPQQMIELDHPVAVEALTKLARNVPPEVEIGRPLAAVFCPHEYATWFRTTRGTWFSFPAHAERLTRIDEGSDDEITELVSWFGQREVQRTARRSSDLDAATA